MFTDDELHTLKAFLSKVPPDQEWAQKQLRLIHRLEAAEKALSYTGLSEYESEKLKREWRKAKGE